MAIGGGTGLSTLLKGLKAYTAQQWPTRDIASPRVEVTAIVTVTDDGGSSGRLRRDFDILPPGDIRNCMVALSEDEALLARLFQHRFTSGRGLKGHSFGNLFLAALTQVTGDFAQAVRVSSEVLAIAGKIHPSTAANVTLRARLEGGKVLEGESRISRTGLPIRSIELVPAKVQPMRETLEAIRQADLITFGPGSLFTSVIPNLLVQGIPAAIRRSPAIKACFVNLMWQPGETNGMSAADHVKAILDHARGKIVDCAVVNTEPISDQNLVRYARARAMQVANDVERIRDLGVTVVGLPLLANGEAVRHDPAATARIALELAKKGRRKILRRARTPEGA